MGKKIPLKKGSVGIRMVAGPEGFGNTMTAEQKQQWDQARKESGEPMKQ